MNLDELDAVPPARLPFPVTRTAEVPVELRAEDTGPPMLRGQFTTFDDPYEVNSHIEGHFLERMAPGAFDRTISESRDNIKVLYDHGQDPTMGNQVLGKIVDLRNDARFTVQPFDGIPPLLRSGLEAGAYGSSHRFSVIADKWDHAPKRSSANPDGIPERTITEARLYEFGPVTFPANPNATAGIRSTTDSFYRRTRDPEQFESLLRSAQVARTPVKAGADATAEGSPQSDAGDIRSPEPDAQRNVVPSPDIKETTLVSDSNAEVTRAERPSIIDGLQRDLSRFADEHPGSLTAEQQQTWDNMAARLKSLKADEAADESRRAMLGDMVERADAPVERSWSPKVHTAPRYEVRDIHSPLEVTRSGGGDPEKTRQLFRDTAMRGVENAVFPHPDAKPDEVRGHIEKLLRKDSGDNELARRIMLTGSQQYERAFSDVVRGVPGSEVRYAALEVVGTTTTGGYAVPYVFDPTFIATGAYTNINPFRTVCRVEQIVGGNKWQGVSVGAVLAQYDTESDAVPEGGPTFSNPSVTVTRATAGITLSYETMQDRPDITSELAVLINEAKDTLEENKFSVGAGSNNSPLGMFVKSTFTVKETITDNVFAVADLDATEADLPLRHRRPAIWGFARGVIRIIQGWETAYGKYFNSTLGYPAVGNPANNPGGNTGVALMGYPVWEFPSAPVTVTGDDTIVGILVNPSQYLIVDRVGMDIEVLPKYDTSTGMPTGTRALLAVWRNSAKAVNADGGRQVNIN